MAGLYLGAALGAGVVVGGAVLVGLGAVLIARAMEAIGWPD